MCRWDPSRCWTQHACPCSRRWLNESSQSRSSGPCSKLDQDRALYYQAWCHDELYSCCACTPRAQAARRRSYMSSSERTCLRKSEISPPSSDPKAQQSNRWTRFLKKFLRKWESESPCCPNSCTVGFLSKCASCSCERTVSLWRHTFGLFCPMRGKLCQRNLFQLTQYDGTCFRRLV